MPIYEYKCAKCGTLTERLQGIGAKPPACDKCCCEMKRQVSRTSFVLKGGGWFKDRYESASNRQA